MQGRAGLPVPPAAEASNSAAQTADARSIPSLDGLRALAISLVLLAHCGEAMVGSLTLGRYLFELGQVGVSLFYVISGFLITFLLEKEKTSTNSINLKSFYIRRAFRIFPPFYVYIAIILLLGFFGIHQRWQNVVAAATYTWNYFPSASGGLLAHTSTLSMEEQFYLFWPFCVKFLNTSRVRRLALWLIILTPFSRVATYFLFPVMVAHGKVSGMLHTRVDTLMFGCLLALIWRSPAFVERVHRLLRPAGFHLAWIAAFLAFPLLAVVEGKGFRFVYLTLSGMAMTWVLIYVVRKPHSLPGRVLNLGPVKYFGVISYSLYLYQQVFSGAMMRYFPFNLVAMAAATACSYYLVERPSLLIRDRLLHRQSRAHA